MQHLSESDRLFIHTFANKNNLSVNIGKTAEDDIHFVTYVSNIHSGMQLLYENGLYEVSQYQAGKKENELHIYTVTKSLKIAIKSLAKGNKGRKTIAKY